VTWRPWRRGEEKLHVALGVLHQQSRQLLGTVEVTILCARGVFLQQERLGKAGEKWSLSSYGNHIKAEIALRRTFIGLIMNRYKTKPKV